MVAIVYRQNNVFKRPVPRKDKKRWRIHWVFKATHVCGDSSVRYTFKEAKDICIELIKRYPGMELTPVLEVK